MKKTYIAQSRRAKRITSKKDSTKRRQNTPKIKHETPFFANFRQRQKKGRRYERSRKK